MIKKLLFIMVAVCSFTLAFGQNEEKYSVTTQMFLQELQEDPSTARKAQAKIRANEARLGLIPVDKDLGNRRLYASPDTIGGVAYIPAYIRLADNNNTSELEAQGVIVQEKFGKNLITSLIPVDKISEVAGVSNVRRINVSELKRPQTHVARQKTNVDDLLTLSTDAISAGLTKKYDGTGVVLGVIDTGIDFNHIAFKDKNGNSRIKQAYVYNGSTATTYSTISSSTLTDDNTADHGTHTSTTAGGSSVVVNGTTVTVTDDHANATYGGMAPGADLYLAGINSLTDTYLSNAVKNMCTYADSQNKPLVVSNSWGSQFGPHDGTGDVADVYNSLFGDSHPNRVALFAASNDGGKSKDNEGGGYHLTGTATSSSPLRSILRSAIYTNTDGGYYYYGPIVNAWARSTSVSSMTCKIHVLNASTGAILKTVTVSPTTNGTSVSGLTSYFSGTLYAFKDYVSSDKTQVLLYTSGLTSQSVSQTTKNGSTYYTSNYTLAVELAPSSGSSVIDVYGGSSCYFTKHLTTSGYAWTAGSDDGCFSDEATIANAIPIGAYVSTTDWTDYKGTAHTSTDTYTMGDIAYFSSWGTAANNPIGTMIPWISAPGARLAAGVNHNHTTSVDDYSYYGTMAEDLVVNSSTNPYAMMEGTSMATPTAAGIVALWLQASLEDGAAHKNLTVNDVKQIMKETAITDAYTTTGANKDHFGNGKIDALAGVQYILGASAGPTITATPASITFDEDSYATLSYTKTVTVKGVSLEGNIKASLSGNSSFSIDKASIAQTDGVAQADITITWNPTATGTQTATLKLSSTNADDVTVSITGTAKAATPTIIATDESEATITSMSFETTASESESKTFRVTGRFLNEDISVALNDASNVFSINTALVSGASGAPASDGQALASALNEQAIDVTVTFLAKKAGSYTGSVVLSSNGATTVTINLSATANPKQTTKDIYKLVSSVTSGRQYLIVSARTAGTGNAISSSASNAISNNTVTIKTGDPGDGSSCTYIEDPNTYSVWTAGTYSYYNTFAVNGYYLYHNNNSLTLSKSTSSHYWTVGTSATRLYYSNRGTRYLTCSSGTWSINTSSSYVYFYEKTTINIPEEEDSPTITATPNSLTMNTIKGVSTTAVVTVGGSDLEGNITASLTDANHVFSIDNSTVTAAETETGKAITVTFLPTAAGTFNATLTLSSTNADNVTVNITGTATQPELLADPDVLNFNTPTDTPQTLTFDVLGADLAGNVTATLTDASNVFTLSKTTISTTDAENGAELSVTFTPTAVGTYSGSITLSSDHADDVTVTLNATATKVYPDYFDVTISGYGVTTLYLDFPVEIPYDTYDPDLLGVYYAYGMNGNEVRLARLNSTIPANCGVVVQGNSGTYRFPKTSSAAALTRTNLLTGTVENTTTEQVLADAAISDGTVLTLGIGSGGYIGFYKYTGTTLAAYKAFFIHDNATGESITQLSLSLGGATTGIDNVGADGNATDTWHTLQGITLGKKPTSRGIYIHNGKRVLVK